MKKPYSEYELLKEIERHYDNLFSQYFSQWDDDFCNKWDGESIPFGGGNKDKIKARIKELLLNGERIRCGYFTTSIRGYHDRKIFIRNSN